MYNSCDSCRWKSTKAVSDIKLIKSYIHGASNVPLLSKTIGQLVDDQAERRPDDEVFILPFQNIRKTFAEFRKDVDAFAAGLLALDLKRADRVGMWGQNSYEWLVTQFAAAKAGFILVNVNPAYRSHELEYCLNKVQVKALVCPSAANHTEILQKLSPDLLSRKKGTKTEK